MTTKPATKRTPQDWTNAALLAIADNGIPNVSVERLAKQLGVTKGSFYWHFANREALIEAALGVWETQATQNFVAKAAEDGAADDRLRSLFLDTMNDADAAVIDHAVSARMNDAVVGPVVQRVAASRVSALASILRELGYTPAWAERQSRIVLVGLLGHLQLRASLPGDKYLEKPSKPYVEELLASVLGL